MTTESVEIVEASLRVASDLGHGGASYEYHIKRAGGACEATVRISRSFPRPGERRFRPNEFRETLHKEARDADAFLERLSREHKVFGLGDRPCPTVFLHPTFYRFDFTDARGLKHAFEYSVEALNHHGDAHRRLVADFEQFFERERVSRAFDERRAAPEPGPDPEPPAPPRRPW